MSTVPELATRYAALVALKDALVGELSKTSAELRGALWAQGLTKGTVATPLGPLTLRANNGGTTVAVADEDALIGWCEVNSADSVEHIARVRPGDREQILTTRFVAVAGKVIDSLTGEVVEFATVKVTEQGPPTPSYGASELQREVKKAAAEIAAVRAGPLVEALTVTVRELASEPPEYDKLVGE